MAPPPHDPMRCPDCWERRRQKTRGFVLETRTIRGAVRRRRECPTCGHRWNAYETTSDPRDVRHARPSAVTARMAP